MKWLCWFKHRWRTYGQRRDCARCGKTQRLTLVNFGQQKVWL